MSVRTNIPNFSKVEAESNPAHWVEQSSSMPFYSIMLFTFILYVTPQAIYPVLAPLRLAMLSIVIAGTGYILSALSKGKKVITFDKETKLVLSLFLLSVLSVPFGIWRSGALEMLTEHYVKVIILFLLISNIVVTTARLKMMFRTLIISCFYISNATIQNYFSGNLLPNSDRPYGPPGGIAENPNDMSLTVALAIPLAFSFFKISRSKFEKLLCAAYILFAGFAIICSLSRSGVLTLAVILLVFVGKILKEKVFKGIILGLLCVSAFLLMMPGEFSSRFVNLGGDEMDSSAQERSDSALNAITIILENPLLGVGAGQNTLALNEKGLNWTAVHNVYLQYGADLGVLAMLIFIRLVFRSIRNMNNLQKGSRLSPQKQEIAALAQALEVSLIAFAVGANFSPVAYRFHFYYLAGFAVALSRISSAADHVEVSSR